MSTKKRVYLAKLHWKKPVPTILFHYLIIQVKYASMGKATKYSSGISQYHIKITKYGNGMSQYHITVFIVHTRPNFKF